MIEKLKMFPVSCSLRHQYTPTIYALRGAVTSRGIKKKEKIE